MSPSIQKKAEKPTFINLMTFKPPVLVTSLRTARTILMKIAPGIVSAKLIVMTNFIRQLDWATGCPDISLNIIFGCACESVSRKKN